MAAEQWQVRVLVVGWVLVAGRSPAEAETEVQWPPGMPLPPVGGTVYLADDERTWCEVTAVDFYPQGDPDDEPDDRRPFVYLVLRVVT